MNADEMPDVQDDRGGTRPAVRLAGGYNNEVFAVGGLCLKRYRVDERPRLDRAWRALVLLAEPAPRVCARCDPNLANCLLYGGRVALVDWENSGRGDLAFELADLVEAYPSRVVSDDDWTWFVDRFDVDRRRLAAFRRLSALHWTFLLHRSGSPALPEQVARCGRVLSG